MDYLKAAEKKLHKGSIIIADNTLIARDKMLDYLDYVQNSGKFKSNSVKVKLFGRKQEFDEMEISRRL